MSKFTTIENLRNQAYQSIVGDIPTHGRVELGTKTLDDRDYWENINFNENTFQPYLTGNLETLETELIDGIVYRTNIGRFSTYQYSVDALPFVTDPNNDNEIIRLDEYYDKKNNSNEYYLATEGKINYYLYARESGRPTPDGHIDNYSTRNTINRFDSYAQNEGDTGFYLFKLNWGDGTEIEYTDEIGRLKEPKLLEGSTLLEHTYEKPGFYTISGVVYARFAPGDGRESIGGYERFETNILLNPSKTYEFDLYEYDNFATIGGISLDSTLIKSSLNTIGINPINPLDDSRASSENIEELNLLDKLQLFNFLNKVSDSFLNQFEDLLEPYSNIFDNTPLIIEPSEITSTFELNLLAEQISGEDVGEVISSPIGESFSDGDVVNIQATTSDGYEFDGWEVTIGEDSQIENLSSPNTFVTMTENITVYATFKLEELEDFDGEDTNPDSDFDDPIGQLGLGSIDIDIDNYVFPLDEYFGEPSPNEIFVDSNNVIWQYTWLTNEEFGITISPNNLTAPPQYDWLIQGIQEG